MSEWHLLDIPTVVANVGVDPSTGLSAEEVALRRAAYGPNELQDTGGASPLSILWEQFTSTMALILTAAAVVSGFVGSLRDSLTIMTIVCLFALLGFTQEYRADRAIRALKRMAMPIVRVRRTGAVMEIPAVELVPGDIVLLETGNLAPADCRVMESKRLTVQESMLTGEAEAVEKSCEALVGERVSIGDRRNMIYSGTTISSGRGIALVVATGMTTELGRIAAMLQEVATELTPLQRRLDRLGKVLALVAIGVSAVVFGVGLMRGEELRLMLMTAVSLAVAAIPEGLPAVVTITLAIGAQRMLTRKALIRKLPAVETLGSVTVICTDKTGTLTENRMTVTEIVTAAEIAGSVETSGSALLLTASALCNDAFLREEQGREVVIGDPTEAALLAAARSIGLERSELETWFPRLAEVPFDSGSKRMITLHRVTGAGAAFAPIARLDVREGDRLLLVKGASDALIPLCSSVRPTLVPDDALHLRALAEVDRLASQGRRVLAVAGRVIRHQDPVVPDESLDDLALFGLIAMMDPPRPEAKRAVERCRQAGIRTVMITGDHPLTAGAIAGALGIDGGGRVVTGAELDRIGPEGLAAVAGEVSVYARVSPEHKLLIIEALKQAGEVAAMTGDGVNDAPALKKADIGIAMGISGTDAAKEAADMVLLDDNFATIAAAVEEGRTIYDNIRKFIDFSVAGNMGKILAVLILPFLGLPIPLTPLQLLWLNLLTDGLLGLGMGMERAEPDVMQRPPIPPGSQIFDRRMIRHTLLTGAVIGISTILLTRHYWSMHPDGSWQTVLFTSLAFAQIGQALALRSYGHSLVRIGLFTNPLLPAMIAAVILLQGVVVYIPVLRPLFVTLPLSPEALAWAVVPGVVVFAVLELEKLAAQRK